jgi:hypothetical protein
VLGLTVEEAMGPPFEVWAENWDSVTAFDALGTQWRTGAAGPTGLDYAAVPTVLRLSGVPRSKWGQVFGDIRLMEASALEVMQKRRK